MLYIMTSFGIPQNLSYSKKYVMIVSSRNFIASMWRKNALQMSQTFLETWEQEGSDLKRGDVGVDNRRDL